ncbi:hypothetical protein [Legionella sp. CNM-4043-24]|uniref:hypothetical protein n=1 Tax=Legionella sp. CNM-4043-24 TaxID=3421646 RepID=UPI00403B31C7
MKITQEVKMRSKFFIDQFVILKDNSRLPMSSVTNVVNHLSEMRLHETGAYYQFVQHCRYPAENILKPGHLPLTLIHRNLIDSQGNVSDEVRAIVVCSSEGIGIAMSLVSPVKSVEQSEQSSYSI